MMKDWGVLERAKVWKCDDEHCVKNEGEGGVHVKEKYAKKNRDKMNKYMDEL